MHKGSRIANTVCGDSVFFVLRRACFSGYRAQVTQVVLSDWSKKASVAGFFPEEGVNKCPNFPQTVRFWRNVGNRVAKRIATRFSLLRQTEQIRGQNREFVFARHVKQ
jgi:hypothetical protein